FDSPGAVILEVFTELDRLGTAWSTTSQDYRESLRKDLSFSVYACRSRTKANFKSYPEEKMPAAVSVVGDLDGTRDFVQLAEAIRAIAATEDCALLSRLDEIVEWRHFDSPFPLVKNAYNTAHEIEDLLSLARGLRNAQTHKAEIPFHLYGVA